jgi:hypothetical protein
MKITASAFVLVAVIAALSFSNSRAKAHCDALDGPVVQEAKLALQKGDVTPVLKWIKPSDEREIRDAFSKTLKVRATGDAAQELADTHFFETLVRVHRAGEGVSFTGLKPAGSIDPGIAAADKALLQGSAEPLAHAIAKAVEAGIMKRFAEVAEKKKLADASVEAGRAYVAAYAGYVHYVEGIAAMASPSSGEHQHLHAAEHGR